MSIHDINSNYKPQILDVDVTLTPASGAPGHEGLSFSGAIDLSGGTTTCMSYMATSFSSWSAHLSIEYSIDAAFTNPVADPGNLGNSFRNADGSLFVNGAESPGRSFFTMNIVNPPSTISNGDLDPQGATAYRYARMRVLRLVPEGVQKLYSIQKTGPQNYVPT